MQVIEVNFIFWKSSAPTILCTAVLFAYYLFAPAKYNHFGVYVILGVALLVSVFILFRRILAPRPQIRIDSEGITDNRCGVGFVPWAAVESAELQKRKGQRWIAVTLKDASNAKAQMGRRAKFDRILFGNDMTVQFGDMDVSADDALVLVNKYLGVNP